MTRSNRPLQHPTFAQTVVIIQTLPPADQEDREAIIQRHLELGFTYQNDQIHRALKALTDPARPRRHTNRPSAPST